MSPANSDTVYAAVPGALWSDSPERGLYKTTDGGKTWKIVLKGANLSTGASAIALDPADPNKMFAAMWDFRRKGWTFRRFPQSPATANTRRKGAAHVQESGGEACRYDWDTN